MTPHLEEAARSLRLAERDAQAFKVLIDNPDVHSSIAFFHAQQAIEKALKAILFLHGIEFERTHDLAKLARLLRATDVAVPLTDQQLRTLNPFAVMFRYDDLEIDVLTEREATQIVTIVCQWATDVVRATLRQEGSDPESEA